MSSIMRWRNGLMGLSSIAKAPVSHGVQNPMILRQSDASRCPGLQPLTPTLPAHRESGLVRRREADAGDRGSPRCTWAERDRWPNAGNGGLRACKARQGRVWHPPFCGFCGGTSCPHEREPAPCHSSVARRQSREKRRVRGEPAGYELGEEPHALRLACLPLCEKPNRSVHVQVRARHPRQEGVGVADEARQRRHTEPLPYSRDLRLAVRGPERNPRGANLAGPIRDSVTAYDDPPEAIRRARTPRG